MNTRRRTTNGRADSVSKPISRGYTPQEAMSKPGPRHILTLAERTQPPQSGAGSPFRVFYHYILVKTVDLVDHVVDVLVEMGLEILEINARLYAGLDMGDAADIAAVHGEDGGEEVFHILGIGRTII